MNREFERQAHARVQQRVRYSYVSRLVTDCELADLYEPLLRFIIIGCTYVAA